MWWLRLVVSVMLILKANAKSCNNFLGFALGRCNSQLAEGNVSFSVIYTCNDQGQLYRTDYVGWGCPQESLLGKNPVVTEEPYLCSSPDDDVCGILTINTISPCTAADNSDELIEFKTQHYYVTDYCIRDGDLTGNATKFSCIATNTYTLVSYPVNDACDNTNYDVVAQSAGCNTNTNESFSISCISSAESHLPTILTSCLFAVVWFIWSNL